MLFLFLAEEAVCELQGKGVISWCYVPGKGKLTGKGIAVLSFLI